MTPLGFFRLPFFKNIFSIKENLDDNDRNKAKRFFVLDGVFSTGMATLQGGGIFLAAFATRLGASNYEIGLITTLTFLSQLVQVPGLFLVSVFPKRKALTIVCSVFSRFSWLLIAFIPVLFVSKGVSFLLQWLMVSLLFGGLCSPAWNSLIRDVIPDAERGSITSRRMKYATFLSLFLSFGAGFFVDFWGKKFPSHGLYAFSFVFGLGFVFAMLSTFSVSKIPEPPLRLDLKESWKKTLTGPLEDLNFRRLLAFSGVWTFAVSLAGPFFVIYMLKRIEISIFAVTLLAAVSHLAAMAFIGIWGRAADRFSNRAVLSVAGSILLFSNLGWVFTTLPEKHFFTIPLLVVIQFFTGMGSAGVNLSTANIALKLSPPGKAHSYMTVFGIVAACAGGMAPLVGGVLADFFSARELSFSFNWADPSRQVSLHAFNLKALDFVFILSFLTGLLALKLLTRINEQGSIEEKRAVEEVRRDILAPFKTFTSFDGMMRFINVPFSVFYKSKSNSGD